MKTLMLLFLSSSIFLIACQKSVQDASARRGNTEDSAIVAGDTLSYEVLTSDTGGWFGVWNRPDSGFASNVLDSITYGTPLYLPSGWKYTFIELSI